MLKFSGLSYLIWDRDTIVCCCCLLELFELKTRRWTEAHLVSKRTLLAKLIGSCVDTGLLVCWLTTRCIAWAQYVCMSVWHSLEWALKHSPTQEGWLARYCRNQQQSVCVAFKQLWKMKKRIHNFCVFCVMCLRCVLTARMSQMWSALDEEWW